MKKKLILAGLLLFLLSALTGYFYSGSDARLRSRARIRWKERAIGELAAYGTNSGWIQGQILSLKTNSATDEEWATWVSQDLILMTNGDWMIYRNVCSKEPERIPDLFIGRGSNGRWYYSTYHFCIRMLVLKSMMEQPASLAAFEKDGFLREFDGQSDDCLRSTWPKPR